MLDFEEFQVARGEKWCKVFVVETDVEGAIRRDTKERFEERKPVGCGLSFKA